jgi:hypothetical protein
MEMRYNDSWHIQRALDQPPRRTEKCITVVLSPNLEECKYSHTQFGCERMIGNET